MTQKSEDNRRQVIRGMLWIPDQRDDFKYNGNFKGHLFLESEWDNWNFGEIYGEKKAFDNHRIC